MRELVEMARMFRVCASRILIDAEQIGAERAGATAGQRGDEDEGPAVT